MECKLKEILRLFMQSQSTLNELFNEDLESIKEDIESIKKELADNDEVNESIVDCLTAMTKCMNDLESRLNKLEKERRNNASNK
jgi:phage terminase Nu1 subunit (DNA packaging protein)